MLVWFGLYAWMMVFRRISYWDYGLVWTDSLRSTDMQIPFMLPFRTLLAMNTVAELSTLDKKYP
jgi:hypothetical protein